MASCMGGRVEAHHVQRVQGLDSTTGAGWRALEMVWSNPRVIKLGYGLWLGLPRETSMIRFLMGMFA